MCVKSREGKGSGWGVRSDLEPLFYLLSIEIEKAVTEVDNWEGKKRVIRENFIDLWTAFS